MKLIRTNIDRVSGVVSCEVVLQVQNSILIIPFSIQESELISNANNNNRYTWDDIDIKMIGESIVKGPIEL